MVTNELWSCRYFYRACQGSLCPSPTRVGRQLDQLSRHAHANLLSLGRIAAAAAAATSDPLGLKAAFSPLAKPLSRYSPPQKDHPKSPGDHPKSTVLGTGAVSEPSETSEDQDPSIPAMDIAKELLGVAEGSRVASSSSSTPLLPLPREEAVRLGGAEPGGGAPCVAYTRTWEQTGPRTPPSRRVL